LKAVDTHYIPIITQDQKRSPIKKKEHSFQAGMVCKKMAKPLKRAFDNEG
jgi:hypothetical protein